MSQNFSHTILANADFEHNRLTQLAQQYYLNNPVLMHQLCDRVYERLYKNLKIQKERIGKSSTGRQ